MASPDSDARLTMPRSLQQATLTERMHLRGLLGVLFQEPLGTSTGSRSTGSRP